MKITARVSIALFAIFSSIALFFTHKKNDLFFPEIIDYPHKIQRNALFEAADRAKYAQDYQKANTAFERLLTQPLSTADSQYVLNQLAYINLTMNEDSAAGHWIQILEDTKTPLSKESLADYHYNVGTFAYRTFKLDIAENHLHKALNIYRVLYGENHLKVALCLTQLGIMYYEFSQELDSAFNYIPKAYDIFQKNKSLISFSAECELGLACLNITRRSHVEGESHCENALQIIKNATFCDTILMARCLSMKGQMLKKQGQFEREDSIKSQILYKSAEISLKQAVHLGHKKTTIRLQQFYRELIINYYWLKDSISYFNNIDSLEKILKNKNDIFGQPDKLRGYYYYGKKDFEKSKDFHLKSWKKQKSESLQNALILGETLNYLRLSYINLERFDSAEFFLKQSFLHRLSLKDTGLDMSRFLDTSIHKNTSYIFVFFAWMGETLFKKYRKTHDKEALLLASKAYNLTDALLFPGIPANNEDAILTFQREVADNTYHLALETVYELYKITKKSIYLDYAFKFCERPKSFLLYRDMPSQEDSLIKILPPVSLIDSIRFLGSEIDQLSLQKAETGNVSKSLIALKEELDKIFSKLKIEFPDYFKLKVTQPILSIKEIQSTLNKDAAIIQYHLSNEKIHALFISQNDVKFVQLDSVAELLNVVKDFRHCLSSGERQPVQDYIKIASSLYDKLIRPFSNQIIKTKELIIIPDRVLHLIPFEAFINSDSLKKQDIYKTLPYLIKYYNISYSPAWKIYQNNLRKTLTQQPLLWAFTYGNKPYLKDNLSNSQKEIDSIKHFWNKDWFYSSINEDCNKQNFLLNHGKYNIIHLSLHGASNLKDKNDNKIFFKIPLGDTLYGYEIARQNFNAFLVVLSACNTSTGKSESGEGIYSLARSFLQAGVGNVIASLWKIDDSTTSELVPFFYQNLKKTGNAGLALSLSKNDFLKKKADNLTGHPKYWAGLVCNH